VQDVERRRDRIKLERARRRDERMAEAEAVRKSLRTGLAPSLFEARANGYPDAVVGSRADGRGTRGATQRWFGQEPNPYAGQPGEHATLLVGPERRRRAALKVCAGGLLPVLLTTSWAGVPSAQA
jgi:hypothetical protein